MNRLLRILSSAAIAVLLAQPAAADDTISLGLTLKIPSAGQQNWGALFRDEFAEPISSHDHTGGGKGVQLGPNSLTANAITDAKIRLSNNAYLRARNFANNGDLQLIKADTSDKIRFDSANVSNSTRSDLGLAIGTNVQAYDAQLADVAGLTPTDNAVVIGNGSNFVVESGGTLLTSLGLGSLATASTINNANWSGTDLSPANGGTGSSGVPTNGQIPIGNGSIYNAANLTGTANQLTVTNGSSTITLSLPQDIATGSSPTFAGATFSGLTASALVATNGSKALTSSVSGLSPTFTGLNLSGLTASRVVTTDGSKNLATDTIQNITNSGLSQSSYSIAAASANGGSTLTMGTVSEARYYRVGPDYFFEVSFQFTLAGGTPTVITVPAPAVGTAHGSNDAFICGAEETAAATVNTCRWRYSGSGINVILPGLATWQTSGTNSIHIQGRYQS